MARPSRGFLVGTLLTFSLCQYSGADEHRMEDAELESGYWACYVEARERARAEQRMDESAIQGCALVSHEIQRRKFDGDFGRLHAWTLANVQTRVAALPGKTTEGGRVADPPESGGQRP